MAFAIVIVLGVASFAIDLGSALVTRAELQNTADSGSLAATREVAVIYKELGVHTDYKAYQLTGADLARIQTKAATFALANKAAGVAISVPTSDIVTGTYDVKTGAMTPTTTGVRAVSVRARRDENANGNVQTTLGRVLGINELSISAQTASGLSALGTLKAGKGEIPIAISQHWFDDGSCASGDNSIRFYPTGDDDGCAGWHTFEDYPPSAARLGTILNGLESGTFTSPETIAGETYYNFIGGTVASKFDDMKSLYDSRKDSDGNWTVNVPVYESDDCSNPNGSIKIIGFARATIYEVTTPPDKTIYANVECGIFNAGEIGDGNGPNDYGTLVGTPGMIQ